MKRSFTIEENPLETTHADSNTKQFDDLLHEDYAQDIKLKKQFSWATYILICVWLFAVLATVLVTLIFLEHSPWVLVALITTSTIKVLGLYYVVLKYIFP